MGRACFYVVCVHLFMYRCMLCACMQVWEMHVDLCHVCESNCVFVCGTCLLTCVCVVM